VRDALTRDERGEPAGPIGALCDALSEIRFEAVTDGAPGGEGAP